MDRKLKNQFVGAITGGIVDAALESLWLSNMAYWSGKFPFIPLDPLPPSDDLIAGLGTPAAIYAGSKLTKNPSRAQTLKDMAQGSFAYGSGMTLKHTMFRTLKPTPKGYIGVLPGLSQGPSARRDFLPFQQDMTF